MNLVNKQATIILTFSHYSQNTCIPFLQSVLSSHHHSTILIITIITILSLVVYVSQWLGYRSLPADFSCPAPDLSRTDDHLVGKLFTMGQPNRLTQPSIPLGSVN